MEQFHSPKIILVDDDVALATLISDLLKGYAFECDVVHSHQQLWPMLAQHHYDAMILDLMLPEENGLSICQKIRKTSNLPILMLSAKGDPIDRVIGLEIGADDYLAKPFESRELIARLKSLLRRSQMSSVDLQVMNNERDQQITRFAGWQLNHMSRQLTDQAGLMVQLSNAEYRLLVVFLNAPKRVLSREVLIEHARGQHMDVFDRSIDILVSRLRQKLRDTQQTATSLIRTVRGEGYLFDDSGT